MASTRILVAEDENLAARELQRKLQRLGYEVVGIVASGPAASQATAELLPDLVLMNIRLQESEGSDTAGPASRTAPDIPVVYLMVQADRERFHRARITDPFGYVVKPFEDRELQSTIAIALYKHAMECKLRETEEWLATTLRSVSDAVIAVDRQGTIRLINPAAEQLTEWPEKETLGQPLGEVYRPIDAATRQPRADALAQALQEIVLVDPRSSTLLVTRNGREIPIDDKLAPIRDARGTLLGGVLVFRNSTERLRLEGRLREAHKLEAVGRLAGGVAHDFNNLLTVITGYCNVMLSEPAVEDPAREMIEEILRAGNRAADLTQKLLAFSRKQMLQPEVLDLNQVVTTLERVIRHVAGHGIRLTIRLDRDPRRVKADPQQIEQVIMNLVMNARQAMPDGGRLEIETVSVKLTADQVHGYPDLQPGKFVRLTICDTGCGMDAETLTHLFEPFFTAKGMGQGGSGLGLAAVYGFVRQSGGCISVESELNRGTTFAVYLPEVHEAAAQPSPAPPLANLPHGTETLLLVEDEPDVRELSRRVLKLMGYMVLEAGHGAEALQVAARHEGAIDLLVTDVVMPEMNGRELAVQLTALRPGIKVLYVSGYADDALSEYGIDRATVDYLQKPFSPQVLVRKVRELLDA